MLDDWSALLKLPGPAGSPDAGPGPSLTIFPNRGGQRDAAESGRRWFMSLRNAQSAHGHPGNDSPAQASSDASPPKDCAGRTKGHEVETVETDAPTVKNLQKERHGSGHRPPPTRRTAPTVRRVDDGSPPFGEKRERITAQWIVGTPGTITTATAPVGSVTKSTGNFTVNGPRDPSFHVAPSVT